MVDASYVESVLKQYNFKKVRRGTKNFVALCPFHDNTDTPAFAIGHNGLWVCNACQLRGNIKQLIERLGGIVGWEEEIKMMGAQLNPARYSAQQSDKAKLFPRDFKPYNISNRPPVYILNRLKWETISHFKLGSSSYGPWYNRCIIPVYFKGKAIGLHGRALSEDMTLKYYNDSGFKIKEHLFNYDGCEKGKDIIVVEGAINAMSFHEKGFTNVVATFGTQFTAKQIQLLFSLAPENIVICFDRDSSKLRPGQKAAVKLAELTYQLVNTEIMPLPFDKDPNDLSAEVLKICYNKKIAYEKLKG